VNVRRALLSVSDKEGIVDLARGLEKLGIEIISTGGTAREIKNGGIQVTEISDVTGFPEMMDGRVKTLHPKIHGGILGRRELPDHVKEAKDLGVQWLDLVAVNLYPFEETVAREGATLEEIIENIDIGGPTLLRSSAKNYRSVIVLSDPADYEAVLSRLKEKGDIDIQERQQLALKAFRRTAAYDKAIREYLSRRFADEETRSFSFSEGQPLRYGENSHQTAVFFRDPAVSEPSVAGAHLLQGKAMSFNNYIDADAALEVVKEVSDNAAVAVIKHTNPCGFATGESAAEALEKAWAGDPISAFGSVIASNLSVTREFAEFLRGNTVDHIGYVIEGGRLIPQKLPNKFVEVIVAPGFEPDALEILGRAKNLRLLESGPLNAFQRSEPTTFRKITGGLLEMSRDVRLVESFQVVTDRSFSQEKEGLALFSFLACKHTKSNAIVLCREYRPGFYQVMGMGAGQPNRVDSLRKLAVTKAQENIKIEYDASKQSVPFEKYLKKEMAEMVLASDAFFPFDDTVRAAAEFGIRYIIQPGGSKRDGDSIAACNELGIAMAFTGLRHFRH